MGALDFGVNAECGNGARVISFRWGDEIVYADNDLFFLFDGALKFVGCFLNFALHKSRFDCAQHAAHRVDLLDVFDSSSFDFVRQSFDRVRARDGIDRVRHSRLMRDDLLCAQRNQRRIFRRQRQRFVQRICVQRLAPAQHRRKRLNRDAHDVVFRLLRRER